MKSSCLAVLVTAAATALSSGVHAAECTTAQVSTADALISTNKALFQSCLADLKSASGAAMTSFISASYVSAAAGICASDSCVKSLIAAMENFPDCCSAVGSSGVAAVTNLPRLADDILHQCDLIDEKLLAVELEKEIEKLPDLKVNIKGTSNSTANGSGSGSGAANATVGDAPVDVIIDVKKRELMKDGKAVGNNTAEIEPQSSGVDDGALVRASKTVLAVAVVAVMSVLV